MADLFTDIMRTISIFTIPILIFGIVVLGMLRNVKVYESFVTGGKEGFDIFLRILPYLVAVFVAIGMFRASGALDALSELLKPLVAKVGMPPEVLPVALMRPLSGSGSMGLASEIIKAKPNSFEAFVASNVFGSTDTTFYVIAVYFGAVGIRKIRHAMVAGLIADLAGILVALAVSHAVWGK
ncbi:MAG: spore maturation protein [Candidatus Sumerlaea chitinivorans]|jgi:spore maturation protein B|nr:spore maturation protein [Candidatus Sumerlaea chitinivorans]